MSNANYRVDVSRTSNGAHRLTVKAWDAAGNMGLTETVVTVENPSLDIVLPKGADPIKLARRKTNTGQFATIEVDRDAVIRVNGIVRTSGVIQP